MFNRFNSPYDSKKNFSSPYDSKNNPMVQYQVTESFVRVHLKVLKGFRNRMSISLSNDILNDYYKEYILVETVLSLRELTLRCFSSKTPIDIVLRLKKTMFVELINNVLEQVISREEFDPSLYDDTFVTKEDLVMQTAEECSESWELLLNLALGRSILESDKTIYVPNGETRDALLEALIDTIIVKISHCIGYILIESNCENAIIETCSSRQINKFRNTLSREFYVGKYFWRPKAFNENRHMLWIITESGVFCRYVFVLIRNKRDELKTINLIIELIDFVSPLMLDFIKIIKRVIISIFSRLIAELIISFKHIIRNFIKFF